MVVQVQGPSLIVAMPWDARPLAEGSASLTKYLERSLHVLTTLYEQTPNANPALLPQWCVLIGMVYTANGFRLYAHYPLWNEGEGRWDYVSVQISEIHDGSFSTSSIVYSFLTARALLCVQRHALEVQTQLNGWIRDYGHVLTTLNV